MAATTWKAKPRVSPKFSAGRLPPWAISGTFKAAEKTILPSSSNQAIRLRAVSAPASNASTNDHEMLVSGKLNR